MSDFDFNSFPVVSAAPTPSPKPASPSSSPAAPSTQDDFDWNSHPAVGSTATSSGFNWGAYPTTSSAFDWDKQPVADEGAPSLWTRLKNVVEGPGSWLGTYYGNDAIEKFYHHPVALAEAAVLGPVGLMAPTETTLSAAKKSITTPVARFENTMTPEERERHPVVSGVEEVGSGLTTPLNLAAAGVIGPAGKAVGAAGEALGGFSGTALKAVPGLISAGFSAAILKGAYDMIPEFRDALDRHDTSAAENILTKIVLAGGLGAYAGLHGAGELNEALTEHASAPGKVGGALKQTDYANAAHEFQNENQLNSLKAEQLKEEGERAVPKESHQQALVNYREAGGDRDLLKAQAMVAAEGRGRIATKYIPAEADHRFNPVTGQIEAVPAGSTTPEIHIFDPQTQTTEIYDPKTGEAKPLGPPPEQGNFVYRSRDVGEKGVPSQSHSQATTSAEEAANYMQSRAQIQNKPQELVRINLDDLTPSDYQILKGPNGNPWIKFNQDLPESVVEKVTDLDRLNALKTQEKSVVPFGKPLTEGELAKQIADQQKLADLKAKLATPAQQEKFQDLAKGYQIAANDLTPEEIAFERKSAAMLAERKAELQKAGLLPKGQVQPNYVHHQWADAVPEETDQQVAVNNPSSGNKNFLRKRVVDTYHGGEQLGMTPENKNLLALDVDYMRDSGNVLAERHLVQNLINAKMNNGAPVVVTGGLQAGSLAIPDFPQNFPLAQETVDNLAATGQLDQMIKDGRVYSVVGRKGPVWIMNVKDYVETPLYGTQMFQRPLPVDIQSELGITDHPELLPSDAAREMNEKRIADLQAKGVLFATRDIHGEINGLKETGGVPVRTKLFANPEVSQHLINMVEDYRPTGFMKGFMRASHEIKQGLLSLSPFHAATETGRNLQLRGPIGGTLSSLKAAMDSTLAPFSESHRIDYQNLPEDKLDAIRDGLAIGEVRPRSTVYTEEGLAAGDSKSYINRALNAVFKPVEKSIIAAAEKTGLDEKLRKNFGYSIENLHLNPNLIFQHWLFGQNGYIARLKFDSYSWLKPQIRELMAKEHPELSDQELDVAAGREAARQINSNFGGLNLALLGRSMKKQAFLRAIFLAPDFTESTGRNLFDAAGTYGRPLFKALLTYNIVKYLSARALNFWIHHKPGDDAEADLAATHPETGMGVLSADGKHVYNFRDSVTDALHFLSAPQEFAANRLNPIIKTGTVMATGENQYGRKLPWQQRLISTPLKAAVPISGQSLFSTQGVDEPSKTDRLLSSFGVQRYSYATPAEQLAIQLAENRLEGKPVLTGQELLQQQLRLRAEDSLRDAYHSKDKTAIKAATAHLNELVKQHMMSPRDLNRVLKDARETRLQSIFVTLAPSDALDVWDKATESERKQLAPELERKYSRWLGRLQHDGKNIRSLDPDDKQTYARFKAASGEVNRLRKSRVQ